VNFKKVLFCGVGLFLILPFLCPLAGQVKGVKFKDIEIPYTLKHKDTVIEKGRYDLEIMLSDTSTVRVFFLRFLKKNKALFMIEGRKIPYETQKVTKLHRDPNIPDQPRLTMRKVTSRKKLYIYFESGKNIPNYPFEKIRYEIDYLE
jgi:hypothetical protein